VAVFVSNDGRSFTPVVESNDFDDTWTFTGAPVVGRAVQRVAGVELAGTKSRFVRLDFYSDGQWTFLSEVVFLGGP
jgi:hypothetical protein